jgi:ligand-binding sensor domain-containing protein/signal transduction histidine kinase/DNA-binding response OmpR family regulator
MVIIKVCLALLITSCAVITSHAQLNNFHIQHVTMANGLSSNSITYVFKDSRGFVWIGTTNGLNRYDGNDFVVFKHDPLDANTICDNFISAIVEDPQGHLWIGTQGGGLSRYDPFTGRFKTFYHDPDDENSIPSNFIFHHNSLLVDQDSLLWIGTDKGLSFYDLNKRRFSRVSLVPGKDMEYKDIRVIYIALNGSIWIGTNSGLLEFSRESGLLNIYRHEDTGPNPISNNIITSIMEEPAYNRLWVGTEYGLNALDMESKTFSSFYFKKSIPGSINDNSITSIISDEKGFLWIGTRSGGLNRFNPDDNSFSGLRHDPGIIHGLSDNNIDYLFYDDAGLLWVSTVNKGISIIDIQEKDISLFRHNPSDPESLSNNTIRTLYEDRRGNIWIGTYGGGLNKWNGRNFKHYLHQTDNPNSLSHNIVSSIYEDRNGNLWIGTWGGGLNRMDMRTGLIIRDKPSIHPYINGIIEDRLGYVWIGSNNGLYIWDQEKNRLIDFPSGQDLNDKLTATSINTLLEDSQGNIWICTFDGLNRVFFDSGEDRPGEIIHFRKDPDNINSLTDNRTTTIYEDSKGVFWIGTYGGGLNKLMMEQDTDSGRTVPRFTFFNQNHGLAGNIVYGILEDDTGNLWISTSNGLSKFDMTSESFTNFDETNGLQSNQFYWHSALKSRSGHMYFGGINGLNYFFPDSIQSRKDFPPLMITNLLLFNVPVTTGPGEDGRTILRNSLIFTDSISLKRKDYSFSLEFSAIGYKSQSKIKYAYQLENFDPDWIYTDATKRYAAYSHIRPGNYVFRVKSTNEDGEWNTEFTRLHIRVLPAFYETIWAFAGYCVILVLLLVFFRYQILAHARYKHKIQIEKAGREKEQLYNEMKIQFFTNVSHEFKTPLTLILGPLQNILSENTLEKHVKDQLTLMLSGCKRMLRLINQLLEFRKAETGNLSLKVDQNDIVPLIKEVAYSFGEKSKRDKIKYILRIPVSSAIVWYDASIVETILYNLLSNAFKFTPSKGKISLEVNFLDEKGVTVLPNRRDERFMLLVISDTGIGIPKERMDNLFKRFYQFRSSEQQNRGTGLGLALCKDLVALHHGSISVESNPESLTSFSVLIPVDKPSQTDELAIPEGNGKTDHHIDEILINDDMLLVEFKQPARRNSPLILIVEDDVELISYIGKMLEDSYRIIVATNGKEGFKQAIEQVPDLVVLDIMIPEMNGFELCEKLKTDTLTSHIPVILLTALDTTEDMIRGLTSGADAYIPKPFNKQHLIVRVEKLIEQRKQIRLHYRNELFHNRPNVNIPTADEKFMAKIVEYINLNLAEPGLNVETLSKEAGISSTHLYRKIKLLTGLSTNELIRKARLGKAAEGLSKGNMNVSQVMYDVGFTNPSYFAKCFYEEYGYTPKEFASGKPQVT